MLEPAYSNFRMLSFVNYHDKLSVDKYNQLYISSPLWTRPIRRSLTGNNRDCSLEIIATTVNSVVEHTEYLVNCLNSNHDLDKSRQALKSLMTQITMSMNGLERLKIAYVSDYKYVASIEALIHTLADCCKNVESVTDDVINMN